MPGRPSGVVERLNYIKSFFFDPCDAPLTLYVQTMLPALLEAAILWWFPVPEEIFTAWARPSRALGRYRSGRKGTRGSKSGRKPRFGRLGRIIGFDTNEFIGKRLPGAEFLGRGGVNWLNWSLWRIFAFTQLLGLIWLVWEVVSGFFARWFSLLYETEYCKESARTVLSAVGSGYLISNIVENNGFLALNIQKQRGPVSWGPGGGAVTGRNVTAVASFEVDGSFGQGSQVTLVMWDGPVGVGNQIYSEAFPIWGEGPRTFGVSASYPEGGTIGVSLQTNLGLVLLSSTSIYIQGGPRN